VSPHGILASGGGDSSIKLWNIDTTLDQAHGGALAARHMVPLPTTPATPAPEAVAVLDAPSPADDGDATPAPAGGKQSKKKKKKKQKRGGKADAVVRVALTSRGDRVVVTSRLVRARCCRVAVHPCALLTCLGGHTCLHRRASCLPWTWSHPLGPLSHSLRRRQRKARCPSSGHHAVPRAGFPSPTTTLALWSATRAATWLCTT